MTFRLWHLRRRCELDMLTHTDPLTSLTHPRSPPRWNRRRPLDPAGAPSRQATLAMYALLPFPVPLCSDLDPTLGRL
ncbi:hypothetical protein FA13DRAFT_1733768, partial [Coprinellus micaceus]